MPQPAVSTGPTPSLAVPTAYLMLAAIAAWVQWDKWHSSHHPRNLVALLVSVLAIAISGRYLLVGLEEKRARGLQAKEEPR